MSGYADDYSMSNNAIFAYESGLLPLSKITARALKNAGITISLKQFKELCREGALRPAEWHHTSSRYNRTNFYDLEQCKADLEHIDIARYASKKKEPEPYAARCAWVEWAGSRNHPRAHDREVTPMPRPSGAFLCLPPKARPDKTGRSVCPGPFSIQRTPA